MQFSISGIGAWGPGFCDWQTLRARLAGQGQSEDLAFKPPAPECIPPRERRRAPLSVKLAVEVAGQACAMAEIRPSETACVFASGMGDTAITDYMCRTVVSDHPAVSPTRFHNSVHNAPVGYWSISSGSMLSSNAVAASHHTVPASLLEAISQCCIEQVPVLWASQDIPSPRPFRDMFDIKDPCAFALVLNPQTNEDQGGIRASVEPGNGNWPVLDAENLVELYQTNPSARILACLARFVPQVSNGVSLASGDIVTLPINEHLDLRLESI